MLKLSRISQAVGRMNVSLQTRLQGCVHHQMRAYIPCELCFLSQSLLNFLCKRPTITTLSKTQYF